ncbi:hypothetical protein [Chryseobacterium indoltheticum]|uniref:hypothetical protein n=1 Tax=Chryseobacterium indoltheticum TaxID=254 RepID=UPI003F491B9C
MQSGDELVRVTAMVSAFNKERGNLGNIQMPLDVIYDFVQYKSEPNVWYVFDFSRTFLMITSLIKTLGNFIIKSIIKKIAFSTSESYSCYM